MKALSGLVPLEQNLENRADAQIFSFPSVLLVSTALLAVQERSKVRFHTLLVFPWSAEGSCKLVEVAPALADVCKVWFLPALSG